jgi:ribose 5-phosphate isomerase B
MKVYLASDHAGFALKGALLAYVAELGHEVEDVGPHELNPGDDYPDFILPCAEKVAAGNVPGDPASTFGIVVGGSGQGEAMAANRVKGARAAVFYGPAPRPQTDEDGDTLDLISSARIHNDANMLSLGARFLSEDEAKQAVKRFLDTPFSAEERHVRRIAKF